LCSVCKSTPNSYVYTALPLQTSSDMAEVCLLQREKEAK
jgi:hypothetical protein